MSTRRGNTRERIQEIALKLFTEKGYDKASLREIAEQLGVTKAALYYHFTSKEEILKSLVEDVMSSLQELLDWAEAQPRTIESRRDILMELSKLAKSRWRPLIRFAQANQTQFQKLQLIDDKSIMDQVRSRLFALVSGPDASPIASFRATLAVIAVFLGSVPSPFPFFANADGDLSEVAIEVAIELISR